MRPCEQTILLYTAVSRSESRFDRSKQRVRKGPSSSPQRDSDQPTLHHCIRMERVARDMTLGDMAARTGLTAKEVAALEQRKLEDAQNIHRVDRVFGTRLFDRYLLSAAK